MKVRHNHKAARLAAAAFFLLMLFLWWLAGASFERSVLLAVYTGCSLLFSGFVYAFPGFMIYED